MGARRASGGSAGGRLDRVDKSHDGGAGRLVAMIIGDLADHLEVVQHQNSVGQRDHLAPYRRR